MPSPSSSELADRLATLTERVRDVAYSEGRRDVAESLRDDLLGRPGRRGLDRSRYLGASPMEVLRGHLMDQENPRFAELQDRLRGGAEVPADFVLGVRLVVGLLLNESYEYEA